jgi:hypothetical protein
MASLAQDVHHVVSRAAARAQQHGLHRPRAEVAAAAVRRAVHHDRMPRLAFAEEGDAFDQLDPEFHRRSVADRAGARALSPGWRSLVDTRPVPAIRASQDGCCAGHGHLA